MAPLTAPALYPPSDGAAHTWPPPNYVNPHTRDWTASICILVLFAITCTVFCARIWARFYITRTSGVDDWFIIAAMPALIGLMTSTVLGLRKYGFQLHIYDQTDKTKITVRQITLAIECIYIATSSLTKISILTFYRRLACPAISKPFLILVWASIIFVAAYGITFICVLIFTCWPVEAYWYRFTTSWLKTHKYRCNDETSVLVIIITISTAQDFIACILPVFVFRKLKLPPRQKIALATVFGVGLITCGIGCLRIHYAVCVFRHVRANDPTYDITWQSLGSWVSTAVESNLAIICASAPALKIYCCCLNSGSHETRSFSWYGRHLPSNDSWTSRASTSIRSMFCCFGLRNAREDSGATTVPILMVPGGGTALSADTGASGKDEDSRKGSVAQNSRKSSVVQDSRKGSVTQDSRKGSESLSIPRLAFIPARRFSYIDGQ